MTDFFINRIPLPQPRPLDIEDVQVGELHHQLGDVYRHIPVGLDLIKEKIMDASVNIYEFATNWGDLIVWFGVMSLIGAFTILSWMGISWVVKKICGN